MSGEEIPWDHPNVVYLATIIISEYGNVLEKTSNIFIGVSEKLLPYSKNEIQEAIDLLLNFLNSKESWNKVEKKYPDLIKFILTNDYYKSLRVGYVELAKFIPENDAELCAKADQTLKEFTNKEKPTNELTQEIGSAWFAEAVKINKTISEESVFRLAYLNEKYGKRESIFSED